jgi:hypothetical protein
MSSRILLLVLGLLAAGPASADARAQLHAAYVKFLAQPSFAARVQARLVGRDFETQVVFNAPDIYRVTTPGEPVRLIVGDTLLTTPPGTRGSTRVRLSPPGGYRLYRDPERLAQIERSATVDDLGPVTLGGVAAHRYRFRTKGDAPSTWIVWVGVASGLPMIQLEATSSSGHPLVRTITYTQYGDPSLELRLPK